MARQLEQEAGNVRKYASGGEINALGSMEGWIYKAPLRALIIVKNVDVIGFCLRSLI